MSARHAPGDQDWIRSAIRDVSIRLDDDGGVVEYRMERGPEAREILTLAEAATFLRRSKQTLVNWSQTLAFPLRKLGGQWVVYRPCLEAYLIHSGTKATR
ncbi:MAG: helix-turn-helix domain-containing protein [Actinomycetota bacterium]|nr:helix-turn-helix domain-containing protein [Actinomycetota bacterium]